MNNLIAIVGMACRYPNAMSPNELWENVIAKRQSFRAMPKERLNLSDYSLQKNDNTDYIYSTSVAVLENYKFNRERFKISGNSFRSTDLVHWLALETASDALANTGFSNQDKIPKKTTGVLIGNTLTGELSRSNLMRLRWPYVKRVLNKSLIDTGWSRRKIDDFLLEFESDYKKPFFNMNEDSLAGGLSNTISGRICNHHNFGGGGYTIDGACSSSLLAISNACTFLNSGDLDMVIAGGVDLSLDPFELIGFSRTHALTKDKMRVYDHHSDGFIPGEGCGMLVLMRYDDAIKNNLHCHAIINGWGISSDGNGSITRPEVAGQILALNRAYNSAGYDIASVPLFEGHGTGTHIGDNVELKAYNLARKNTSYKAAISSVKSIIGHTKAAAGVAGVIKTVMALEQQIIPPATGFEIPNSEFTHQDSKLRLIGQAEIWPLDQPLRAGVSSFGFGGIDVHITLSSNNKTRKIKLDKSDYKIINSIQDVEIFFLNSQSINSLIVKIVSLKSRIKYISSSELSDLGAYLSKQADDGNIYASIVAATPNELKMRLNILYDWLVSGITFKLDNNNQIYLSSNSSKPKIGLLFSGQASPVRLNGGAMSRRFQFVADHYNHSCLPNYDDGSTEVAQPCIIAAEIAGLHFLEYLGVSAHSALGHSLGECTALHWAGALDSNELLKLSRIRGKIMSQTGGAMAVVFATVNQVKDLLTENIVIACYNSPCQLIVSGESGAIDSLIVHAQHQGINASKLNVNHAFHSPLMTQIATKFESELQKLKFNPLKKYIFSSRTGDVIKENVNIVSLLTEQIYKSINFNKAYDKFSSNVDFCIEVGPGNILKNIASEISNVPVFSMNISDKSLQSLFNCIAAIYALGGNIKKDKLFNDRFVRDFDINTLPKFITNPCELAPEIDYQLDPKIKKEIIPKSNHAIIPSLTGIKKQKESIEIIEVIRNLVSRKLELSEKMISNDSRLLIDLHLNSISVGLIVSEAANILGVVTPEVITDYADATITDIAIALKEQLEFGASHQVQNEGLPAGIRDWVSSFEKIWLDKKIKTNTSSFKTSRWDLLYPLDLNYSTKLKNIVKSLPKKGCLALLPAGDPQCHIDFLLKASDFVIEKRIDIFVLVQENLASAPFFRTFYLEYPKIQVLLIDIDIKSKNLPEILRKEILETFSFSEVKYNKDGDRFVPCLRPIRHDSNGSSLFNFSNSDVLLVTGGGKGIAAECALAIAKKTGVHLLLLGRSDINVDSVLKENLNRFSVYGINYNYYNVDITDFNTLKNIIQNFVKKYGDITGIIHGAGNNKPCLIHKLTIDDFNSTLYPKVNGINNIINLIDSNKMKLFFTFGSIISHTGMKGESDYAISNEALARITESFKSKNSECHCLCIEWSIWSGIGMGERLGRVDSLLQQGITAISPDQGINIFLQLIDQKNLPVRVIVSGRLGLIPTLRLEKKLTGFGRFLESVKVYYPNIELITEPVIAPETDFYLIDHAVDKEILFPGVIGLEAMAQVSKAVLNTKIIPNFSAVKFMKPIVISTNKKLKLRLSALVVSLFKVEVTLKVESDDFKDIYFQAVCDFNEKEYSSNMKEYQSVNLLQSNPVEYLYKNILFQKGRFKRITEYQKLSAFICQAQIENYKGSDWFNAYYSSDLLLGDPGSNDASLHSVQACIPHIRLLPVAVDSIEFFDPNINRDLIIQASEISNDGEMFKYNIVLHDKEGNIRVRWNGLKLRKISKILHEFWDINLLKPYFERTLGEIFHYNISVELREYSSVLRSKKRSHDAIHKLIGGSATILQRSDGRPELNNGKSITLSHSNKITLVACSEYRLSCDIQLIASHPIDNWNNLLGDVNIKLAQFTSVTLSENINISATRIWCVVECLKKIGARVNSSVEFDTQINNTWVIFISDCWKIATINLFMVNESEPTCFAFLMEMD